MARLATLSPRLGTLDTRTARPAPPQDLLDTLNDEFRPEPELQAWARDSFIDPFGPLTNPEHEHLIGAEIGYLWTNVANSKAGRKILGTAELGQPQGAMGKWPRARAVMQIEDWFGGLPDFIITIDAHHAAETDDASFCALIEHELCHCGQEHDADGVPKFTRAGTPKYAMRGHDVEEFVSVVRRYGIAATGVEEMVRAANKGPEIAAASVAHVCGTCLMRRAA
jgi:hypothetical protein